MNKRKGFTLVELLVVIAIVAILMPALHRAAEQSKRAVWLSNLKQLTKLLGEYQRQGRSTPTAINIVS